MQGPVSAESSETETSPLGSTPKSWDTGGRTLQLFPSLTRSWELGVFFCSFYTKPRKGAKVSERMLVQTTAFVFEDLKPGAPSCRCLDSGKT